MSVSNHEANYTPSMWSKRFGHVEVLQYHYKFITEATKKARKTLKCKLDIPYGPTDRTKYDIYGTDLPEDAPIFVFIHGGYWQEGNKDISAVAASVFVANGIKVITVGYDLCPQVKFGDIVSQIKIAVEEILKSPSNQKSRSVWIAGHSAGAHLAASLLFDESWLNRMTEQGHLSLLKGIVIIGGIFDLKSLLGTTINDALKLTQADIDAYSFTIVDTTKSKPIRGLKVIVTDGECDTPAFIDESRKCAQKLVTMVDDVEYILLRENTDHFDIVERLTDPEFALTKALLNNITRD
ncbi:kynurenine formamidase [Hylaeus anthracinus]|uniref:kynurenine formamidase n=1 Tax=Hylaeus anthracinus TaxID=313031 RepID=UPI0023BA1536|nr:kynurenine formamidase [Hylaeus anthracinus]